MCNWLYAVSLHEEPRGFWASASSAACDRKPEARATLIHRSL
jgi:hypothetical protein